MSLSNRYIDCLIFSRLANIVLLCFLGLSADTNAEPLSLSDSFNSEADQATARLIAQVANDDSSAVYAALPRSEKAAFLDRFWRVSNPLLHKYYFGYHLGQARFNVSDYFFERMVEVPDLFKRHIDLPDPDDVVDAEALARSLVGHLPDNQVALCSLGYVLLEAGKIEEADDAFLSALKRDRKFVEARNGRGLSHLAMGKRGKAALEAFRSATILDKDYAAPSFNTGMTHLVIRSREIGRWFEEVIKRFPNHPDAHFKLGAYHEIGLELEKDPDLDRAALAYQAQVDVNPDHGKAWFQLGSVLLQSGRAQDAIVMWERLVIERPAFRTRYLTQLIEAYQKVGQAQKAEEAAKEYIAGLDEESRGLFKDLSLIATTDEKLEYEALDRWDRLAWERRFWQKRDPSPATEENERRLEHYRRIIHAMQQFGKVRKPWDRRGEVYVRYGEPAHISRWDNMRFEFDADVVKVKNRLQDQLPGSAKREIVARSRRIRESVGDHGGNAGEISDFEGVDFELDPNRRNVSRSGGSRNEGEGVGSDSFSSLDRMGADDIRGRPLYPVEPDKPWEYWIYPNVNGGIEVVFVSMTLAEDFDYPSPPESGRSESSRNTAVWVQKRPETIVAAAVSRKGETFVQARPDLWFVSGSADFMGNGKASRLELYFGVPLTGLSTTMPDTGVLARGIGVYSMDWKPLYRNVDAMRYLYDPERPGQVAVSESRLSLPPGEYIIGTQFSDSGGDAFGAQYDTVTVEPYAPGEFNISDIELASRVFEDFRVAIKGGLRVIANPTQTYLKSNPVLIFYEVYGLTKDEFGQARYQVTYSVSPSAHEGKFVSSILRSIGKVLKSEQKETVTISTEQTGYRTEQSEYIELDVTKSQEGKYDLVVTVTDPVGGASATKKTSFWLREPVE